MNDGVSPQRIRPREHVFLGVIICLLLGSLFVLFRYGDPWSFDRYGSLVIGLTLLFHHLAVYYTKTGWQSKEMKAVAAGWFAFAIVYFMLLGSSS